MNSMFILYLSLIKILLPYLVDSVVVPVVEINSLYDLYISTNGIFWSWNNKSTNKYNIYIFYRLFIDSGIPWNFSVSPCLASPSNWQVFNHFNRNWF
jgi:hypothetical protein